MSTQERPLGVIDAPIEMAEPDATWSAQFESERDRLHCCLAPWLAGPIEHIGSTAVVGLAAKPVIDIMAAVADLEASRGAIAAVAAEGYLYAPYRTELMHWFCKPSPALRTHHLHLVPMGSLLWRQRLAFRDALRADASLARAYAALKHRLADAFRNDRDGYTDAKGPFIEAVLKRRGL